MAKGKARRRDRTQPETPTAASPVDRFERARPWLLGAAAALLVARALIPSVNVEFHGGDAPFALLWLVLLAAALLSAWRAGTIPLRWTAVDKALALLIALHSLSALVALWYGAAPRPAINMLWTWVAYGAAFFVVRQLVRTAAEARALAAVMLALCVAECGYALHEYFISQPEVLAEYRRDPDEALRSIGQWYPADSRERRLFEQRLESTEPVGTFALTNSLAGLLVPWLVVAAGAAMTLPVQWKSRRRTLAALAAIGMLLAAVLLLTKSRSGVVGALAGCILLATSHVGGRFARRRWALAALLISVVAVGGVVSFGGLDRDVLFEAPKSLLYRFEYWRATWAIVAESPWFGCGPGEFKDTYTRFKLPTSSEEISDPHNFLLEVWATAGTPTVAALIVLLAAVAWSVVAGLRQPESNAHVAESDAPAREAVLHIIAGGLCGWVVAYALPFVVGPTIEVQLTGAALIGGVVLGGAVLFALRSWIREGVMSPVVPLAGGAALLVNLLAAGGIGHPGVALNLWLLAALTATLADIERGRETRRAGATMLSTSLVGCLLIAVAAVATLYHPVVRSHLALAAADAEPAQAEEHLLAATVADPYGFEAWRQLAMLRYAAWRQQPSPATLAAFESAARHGLAQRPNSSEAWGAWAAWQSAIFQATRDRAHGEEAVAAERRAVELYPHSAIRQARLAVVAEAIGETDLAQKAAAEALRLHEITPHADQKLAGELLEQISRKMGNGK